MSGGVEAITPSFLVTGTSSNAVRGSDIQHLIDEALSLVDVEHPSRARKQLRALAERLVQGRLQLAVVGQFKRGKSTLLNALLGERVLPSAVTPLTAIATFLRNGSSPKMISEDAQGRREEMNPNSADELRSLLEARVTEDGNPQNRLSLTRVEIEYPLPLLAAGIVLIDTPGVGSTYRHNTETAKATLPECDAALFVVSPDPPITAIEIDYLKELRAVAATIVVVLNKIDLVDGSDRARSEAFLRTAVKEALGDINVSYFSVSARSALDGKLQHDPAMLEHSGLPALENFLSAFALEKRLPTLERAAARKAESNVRELVYEIDMRLGAYRLPATELSHRLVEFRAAETAFDGERDMRFDILNGDRQRLLRELEERAGQLRERVRRSLHWEVDRQIASASHGDYIRQDIAERLPRIFQTEFESLESYERQRLEELLARHQNQADELMGKVRRAAARLLDIPFMAPEASEAFEAKKLPYWVDRPRETLSAAPASLLSLLLPADMKRRRLRAGLVKDADEMVARNVENLRWAIRQNLEDAIRRFQADLDDRLRSSQDATQRAIEEALQRKRQMESEMQDETEALEQNRMRLQEIIVELQKGE